MDAPRPIIHSTCGGLVGHDIRTNGDDMNAHYFRRMDGTYPEQYSLFKEICPECGEPIKGPAELTILPRS